MKQKAKNSFTVNMSMDELQEVIQSFDNYPMPIEIPFHLHGKRTSYEVGRRSYEVSADLASIKLIARVDITSPTSEILLSYTRNFYTYIFILVVLSIIAIIISTFLQGEMQEFGFVFIFVLCLGWIISPIKWMQYRYAQQSSLQLLLGFLGLEDLQTTIKGIASSSYRNNRLLRRYYNHRIFESNLFLPLNEIESRIKTFKPIDLPKEYKVEVRWHRLNELAISYDICANRLFSKAPGGNLRVTGRIQAENNELRLQGESEIYYPFLSLAAGSAYLLALVASGLKVSETAIVPNNLFSLIFLLILLTVPLLLIDIRHYQRTYKLQEGLINHLLEHLQAQLDANIKEKRK